MYLLYMDNMLMLNASDFLNYLQNSRDVLSQNLFSNEKMF